MERRTSVHINYIPYPSSEDKEHFSWKTRFWKYGEQQRAGISVRNNPNFPGMERREGLFEWMRFSRPSHAAFTCSTSITVYCVRTFVSAYRELLLLAIPGGKCPETSTVFAPNPAQWDTRFLGKPFHTLHPGMEWWKEKPLASWHDAERQSVRRGRRVTCRLSHVRESKQRHGFRSSKTSLFVPILIVSPPVYSHTAFLDDFFGVPSPILRWKRRPSCAPVVKALL